jgi:hypothetical protein
MKTELKWSEYKKVPLAPAHFILQRSEVHTCDSTQHMSCRRVCAVHMAHSQYCTSAQVPVAMMDGEVLVDSSAIISRLAAETDAEAAAAQPPPKQGWFSRGKPAQPAAGVSHTGQHSA